MSKFSKTTTYCSVLAALAFFGLMMADVNTAAAYPYRVYVGTQSGGSYGSTGGGAVYRYDGTTWTNISAGTDIGQAVMDLEFFEGHLYAATQTQAGYGGGNGIGQVWCYGCVSDGVWTLTGPLENTDNSAMDLIRYEGFLYVVTTDNYPESGHGRGNLYKYDSAAGVWDFVDTDHHSHSTGFFTATVANLPLSNRGEEIVIGDLNTDKWSTSDGNQIVFRQDSYGSCVWDFEKYGDFLYSGHYAGHLYKTNNATTWTSALTDYAAGDLWALETFLGKLYIGSGSVSRGYSGTAGMLSYLDSSSLVGAWSYEGGDITRLRSTDDGALLFIGTGIRNGYAYVGDGKAEVWTYDGTDFVQISDDDHFAGGVQSLLVRNNTPPDCSAAYASTDCLRPPDHSLSGITIMGCTDSDGDPLDITITSITSDERVDSGMCPDAIVGTGGTFELRAERYGFNGRVYEIGFTASDGEAESSGTVQVVVPMSPRQSCDDVIDDGQDYDATNADIPGCQP